MADRLRRRIFGMYVDYQQFYLNKNLFKGIIFRSGRLQHMPSARLCDNWLQCLGLKAYPAIRKCYTWINTRKKHF